MNPRPGRKIDPAAQRSTDHRLGIYVGFGLTLLVCSSKLDRLADAGFPREWVWTQIVTLACAAVASVATVHYRRAVLGMDRPFYADPTVLAKPDLLTLKQSLWVFGAGILAFVLPPAGTDLLYLVMFSLMTVSVGLNTYFGSFWRKSQEGAKAAAEESLKLEHSAWTVIFNNVCSALMIAFIGGIVTALFSRDIPNHLSSAGLAGSISTPEKTWLVIMKSWLEVTSIAYTVISAPILWLLRPINATLASIRMDLLACRSAQESATSAKEIAPGPGAVSDLPKNLPAKNPKSSPHSR